MKRYIIMAAAAVAALSSCSEREDITAAGGVAEFTATVSDDAATRTTISDRKISWEAGDQISVDGKQYTAAAAGETATFTGEGAELVSGKYHAYYPAAMYSEGTATLPASYTDAGYDLPLYAESETTSLQFKNLTGVIALTIPADQMATVKTVTVASDKRMNGAFTAAVDGTLTFAAEASSDDDKSVTLSYATALAAPCTVYVPVPAGEHTLAVTVFDGTASKTMTAKSASTVERSKLYTLAFKESSAETSKTITLQFIKDLSLAPSASNSNVWPFDTPAYSTIGHSNSDSSKYGSYMNADKDPEKGFNLKCTMGEYEFTINCSWWIGRGSKQGLRFGNWANGQSSKGNAPAGCSLTFPAISGMKLASVAIDLGAVTTAYPYIVRTDKADLSEGLAYAWTNKTGIAAGIEHVWSAANGNLQETAANTSYMLYFSNNDLINIRCLTIKYEAAE